MNAYLQELRTRYRALERREQWALLSLSGFLAVVVFYLAIWVPVGDFAENSRADHERELSLLQYLKSTEKEARSAAGSGKRSQVSGQSMLTAVSRTAQAVGINPSRMQPEGEDAVSVWFDSVAFTRVMLMLERLESEQNIVVRQISMDRRDQPGEVSARIVLRN